MCIGHVDWRCCNVRSWYAKSAARDQSALRQRIRDIAMSRPRFGYLRVLVMLKREGW